MGIGPLQILIILVLVLVIFGAGKLPKVMGDIGKGMKNFKEGLNGKDDHSSRIADKNALKSDTADIERPVDARKKDSEKSKTEV